MILLCAFKPVLQSVNVVSQYLQNPDIDLCSAWDKVQLLRDEIANYRSYNAWERALSEATKLANTVSVDMHDALSDEESRTRKRKLPRTVDSNPSSQVHLSTTQNIKVNHYFTAMDKLIRELADRFPEGMKSWQFLQPVHFPDSKAENEIKKLAKKYSLNADRCATEWRLFRNTKGLEKMKFMVDVCIAVPEHFSELKQLYCIFLTLPVTTASVERGFSKMALIKNKLRSLMQQNRLQALMLASIENDVCKKLDVAKLVGIFATSAPRRMDLG